MASFSLSIVEIVVLMIGAITLGFTIHFFITSKSTMKFSPMENEKISKALEDWKLRYFNDTEVRDKELESLRKQLAEQAENNEINTIEAEEMRKSNKELRAEIEALQQHHPVVSNEPQPGYITQLRQAQDSLMEHNQKITQLLGQIDIVKETEEKREEVQKLNQVLSNQVDELRIKLSQKEREVVHTKQQEQLTSEMSSMIDSAYNEFGVLQEKIQKLEGQINTSRRLNIDLEDLKEAHYRLKEELNEYQKKYSSVSNENKRLQENLNETADKLREANFQRQQLQKRVAYLEELNNDMQAVADTHKRLEGQLKRIGELESMLHVVAEERDALARRQNY